MKEAIQDLTYAIDLGDEDPSTFHNRALAFYAEQEFPAAVADFSKAIELNPNHIDACRNRAVAFLAIGLPENAIADFRRALELENPGMLLDETFGDSSLPQTASCPLLINNPSEYYEDLSLRSKKRYVLSRNETPFSLLAIASEEAELAKKYEVEHLHFRLGLIVGTFAGGYDCSKEMGYFAYSLAFHPVQTSKEIKGALEIILQYIKEQDWDAIKQIIAPELVELYLNGDKLSHYEKGHLIGRAIGKNGLSFLTAIGLARVLKLPSNFKDLANLKASKTTHLTKPIRTVYPSPLYYKEGIPVYPKGSWVMPLPGGRAFIGDQLYTEHALARMAPRNNKEVIAVLEQRLLKKAEELGIAPGTKPFEDWLTTEQGTSFKVDPRGIPASVVEAELANPGSTNIEVRLTPDGAIQTVWPKR